MKTPLIGFVGQGYVGKNYADDFESRGYSTVRYSLEEPYIKNKEKIKECDMVFIAVPTPTTPKGFDGSIVEEALTLVGVGKIAVIKSTIAPYPCTTKKLQATYPDRTILFSPEFLSEATAAEDAAHPFANIVGMPIDDALHKDAAEKVHAVLPESPFSLTCDSAEAEIIKYAHNGSAFVEILFFNLMYDLSEKLGCDWAVIQKALENDPLIAQRYAKPLHKSGRGAGGHCFIKDFEALSRSYVEAVGEERGMKLFEALKEKNKVLLIQSGKDLDLLAQVYGDLSTSK